MDKNIIKATMLSLEGAALQSAREKYFDYVADARLDRSEPIPPQVEPPPDPDLAPEPTLPDGRVNLAGLHQAQRFGADIPPVTGPGARRRMTPQPDEG